MGDNIKTNFDHVEWDSMGGIYLTRCGGQLLTVVSTVMNLLQFP
jgi:hypothetical protein